MKKCFERWILAIILSLFFLFGIAVAETYDLDEALALVGTGTEDMLELNEDLNEIDPFRGGLFQSTGGKSIIIWREDPEKEFETSIIPIDADYEGKDLGEGHTYLCANLMEQIPEEQRAKTSDEIENVLVVEIRYFVSGVITSKTGGEDPELPSLEEIEEEISSEDESDAEDVEDVDEGITLRYKPVFDCYEICYIYNLPSHTSAILDYEVYESAELRNNPQASDLWEQMIEIVNLMQGQEEQSVSALQTTFQNGSYQEFLSEENYQALEEKVSAGDVAGTTAVCEDIFWNMAEGFKEFDSQAESMYDKIIASRSYRVLSRLVNRRAYSSVEKEDWEIRLVKAYIGQPDRDRMDSLLQDSVELLNYVEWDMELMSMAFNNEV